MVLFLSDSVVAATTAIGTEVSHSCLHPRVASFLPVECSLEMHNSSREIVRALSIGTFLCYACPYLHVAMNCLGQPPPQIFPQRSKRCPSTHVSVER